MKPLYGDHCLGCRCLGCVKAGKSGDGGACPCCRECYADGLPLKVKTCSGFEEWPAC